MAVYDSRTLRVLASCPLFGLGLWFIYAARAVLIAFIFAILFAYLLEPAVYRLQNWMRCRRGLAIALLYGIMFGALLVLVIWFGSHFMHQAETLSQKLPKLSAKVLTGRIAQTIGQKYGLSRQARSILQNFIFSRRSQILSLEQRISQYLTQAAELAWWLAVIPILAIFFLKDGLELGGMVTELTARRRQKEFLAGLMEDLHQVLAQFIRAQILLMLLAMAEYTAGFALLGMPYAYALGVMAGLLEFIPMLGPLTSAIIVIAVMLLSGYPHPIYVLGLLALIRVLQDYVISPRVMGGEVSLHPLAVIFGVLAGGEIGGVIGIYFSIPVMASLRVVVRRWRTFQTVKELAPGAELIQPAQES